MGRAWVTGITIGLALAAAPLGAQQTDAPPVPSGRGTPPVERSTTQPRPATVLVAGDLRDGIAGTVVQVRSLDDRKPRQDAFSV